MISTAYFEGQVLQSRKLLGEEMERILSIILLLEPTYEFESYSRNVAAYRVGDSKIYYVHYYQNQVDEIEEFTL